MASDEEGTVATDAGARGARTSKTVSAKKNRTKKSKSSSGSRSTRSRKAAATADSDEEVLEEAEEKQEADEKIMDEDEATTAIVTEVPEAVVEESIVYQNNDGSSFVEENGVVFNDTDGNCIVEEICTEMQEPDEESQQEVVTSTANSAIEEAVVKMEVSEPEDTVQLSTRKSPLTSYIKTEKMSSDEESQDALDSKFKTEPDATSGAIARIKSEGDTPSESNSKVTSAEIASKIRNMKKENESTEESSDTTASPTAEKQPESDIRDENIRESDTKEDKAKEHVAKEDKAKEPAAKEDKAKEPTSKEDKTKESESKKEKVKESETKKVKEVDSKKEKVKETENKKGKEVESKEEKVKEVDSKEDKVKEQDTKEKAKENEIKFPAEPDTEMVSEDELPNESSKEPLETEAVSDEELPEPAVTTDLPETEAVSEDEFPPEKTERKRKRENNKKSDSSGMETESGKKKQRSSESQKRKLLDGDTYDPSSPTSENSCDETPAAKRAALSSGSSSVPKAATKSRKSLPELEKYWKAVKEDPADFTGWTYLLQYVDQENDIEAAREAYDAFLSHYPYCYGYWRKYADYEKRKGNKRKCEEVFERGLKAIPLSVDLWIHYLNYCKATYPDDEAHLRCQFEKAISACGMEFRSDRLWESYIKWESEGKRLQNVTSLYDRLLLIPTQGYTNHFDNFQEHISSNPPQKVLSVDEFLTLRREVLQMLKQFDQPLASDDTVPGEETEAPPGEEPEEQPSAKSDEETTALRERIISIRKKIHKNTVAAVADRWNYEEGIKRPYFHVKPLERCQLKNWKEYLDFEIEQGDKTRIIVLFERCLIACALYEEFWIKFIRYLESLKEDMTDKIRNVYERACTIHHTKKPNLHLHWAVFEESQKNYDKAAEILTNLEKLVPNMLQVAYRRINLERRRNDLNKVAELYEHYINTSKSKVIANNMAIKYARFSWKILGDTDRAISILNKAVEKDKENPRLYLQLIDMGLQKNPLDEGEIITIIDQFLSGDADPEQKVLFAQRKVEFLEDFGKDVIGVQKAHDEFQRYFKMAKDRKKKSADVEGKSDSAKKAKSQAGDAIVASQQASQAVSGAVAATAGTTVAATTTGQYAQSSYTQSGGYSQTTATGAAASSSYQGGQYPAQQPPTPYSQPPYNQQYSQSGDPNYANYQNWGYSQTGYGGYNQGWGNYNYY